MTEPVVVNLAGDFDTYNSPQLRRLLAPAGDAPDVVIDLSAACYLDSTCLTELAVLRRLRIERGFPPMRLVVPTANIRKILHIVGFDVVFPLYGTLQEALHANGFAH